MITLQEVSNALGVDLGNIYGKFSDISMHSDRSGPDVLFLAIPSIRYTAKDVTYMAWKKGTRVVLAWGNEYRYFENSDQPGQICIFQNLPKNTVHILGRLFYPCRPSLKCAVTGTNGKTSTVFFLSQLWQTSKKSWVSMGTLGTQGSLHIDFPTSNINTADYLTLSCALHKSAQQGVGCFAYEASSHGLHQNRVPQDAVDVGIWTSFSQDHLDYHKTMQDYWQAKASLGKLCCKAWLVNDKVFQYRKILEKGRESNDSLSQKNFENILDYSLKSACPLLRYGLGNKTSLWGQCTIHKQHYHHTKVSIRIDGYVWNGTVPWIGSFQCENLVASLGAFYLLGGSLDDAFEAISSGHISAPPGRLERVSDGPAGGGIYIDYAHTPDGLYQVLKALRALNPKKLGVIFGCGGERDTGKREKMGKIAKDNADWVILTDDNPRFEDPEKILDDIQKGCPLAQRIRCRSAAIRAGISSMKQDHIILIAGKGHEAFQWIGSDRIAFQDREVVEEYLGLSSV
ncbi:MULTISPECIES: UDP-N-acetylmuramoyl-L-alanyl-D-glutamate--2,6-diaminopimelate ligase [Holospora]|uniref:UDP-N-acetylmuramoyl-L-alanyl-D-glutamate--2, 6-diaminopimelate ligase n=2 Tax=Holospora TaxID=44747 RepID=A0A061JHB1_9PROT|nr:MULTISPECIES: UDP-N-acetylmuramoyl-L-alanyl-D-glutamate--2,6-diaminopimelate ligase [Holospora]ETZ04613.1 UDP-N-acetylmuramoyl-L-alanyl-D-glutamate--2,6-diaminopimelate ligase [Holospora undulata HU1]GAJ46306.1 UDP-N-acetylmuramoyl-L-alanyl-D-glutamate--2, 6-diaminopimelate ligase [Holospora elegans E1]